MRKKIAIVVAAFALLFAGSGVAQASTHADTCSTDNTIYLSTDASLSSGNGDYFIRFAWSNNYYLNRVAVSWRQDSSHSWVVIGAAGGTSTSLNDVDPSSSGWYVPSNWPTHAVGDGGQLRMTAWGGAGDSTDSCNFAAQNV